MILLWGPENDQPLQYIKRELDLLGEPYFLIDQHKILDSEIRLVTSSYIEEAYVKVGNKIVNLNEVKSIYLRPHESTKVEALRDKNVDSKEFRHASYFDEVMFTWLELTDCLKINKLQNMASNSSKPYQTELIRQADIKIPKTLITTNSDEVKIFHKKNSEIIYKSISGIRSIVSKFEQKDYSRLKNLSWCPTQFQEYINGTDYRVHVVGDKVFTCRIQSDRDDYRYSVRQGGTTKIFEDKLPDDIKEKCIKISRLLGLPVVGIDLRKTDSNDWYCFEANPSPGFSYYESHTKLPIARAIATLLKEVKSY